MNSNNIKNKRKRRVMTNQDLGEWIKRQLGFPIRNVELTEDHLEDAIIFALDEIQPWYTNYNFITIDSQGQTAIDLSEYDVYEVTDIIKIPNNLSSNATSPYDPFSYNPSMGMGVGGYGSISSTYISRLTNNNIHKVISAQAQQWDSMFYNKLAWILQQRTMGSISLNMSYVYNREDGYLYLDTAYPPSTVITLEFIPWLHKFDNIMDLRYIRVAQDFALGQAMLLLARVTGKFDISNAPSKVNFENYRDDGKELIENARAEVRKISRTTWLSD